MVAMLVSCSSIVEESSLCYHAAGLKEGDHTPVCHTIYAHVRAELDADLCKLAEALDSN